MIVVRWDPDDQPWVAMACRHAGLGPDPTPAQVVDALLARVHVHDGNSAAACRYRGLAEDLGDGLDALPVPGPGLP